MLLDARLEVEDGVVEFFDCFLQVGNLSFELGLLVSLPGPRLCLDAFEFGGSLLFLQFEGSVAFIREFNLLVKQRLLLVELRVTLHLPASNLFVVGVLLTEFLLKVVHNPRIVLLPLLQLVVAVFLHPVALLLQGLQLLAIHLVSRIHLRLLHVRGP